jgi:hypothetical protein
VTTWLGLGPALSFSARRGLAGPGLASQGWARHGEVLLAPAWQCSARRGEPGLGKAGHRDDRQASTFEPSTSTPPGWAGQRQSWPRQGSAGRGIAWQGRAWIHGRVGASGFDSLTFHSRGVAVPGKQRDGQTPGFESSARTLGTARRGRAAPGWLGLAVARRVQAWPGEARHRKAWINNNPTKGEQQCRLTSH